MGQLTGIVLKHNIDLTNIETIVTGFQDVLNIRIKEVCFFDVDGIEPQSVTEFCETGFTLNLYGFPVEVYGNIEGQLKGDYVIVSFGKQAVDISDLVDGNMSEWRFVRDALYDGAYIETYSNERKLIYKIANDFGSQYCVVFNAECFQTLYDCLLDGLNIKDAINKEVNSEAISHVGILGHSPEHEIYIEKPFNIRIVSPHEYRRWILELAGSDIVVIDDFRDF